MFPGIYDFRWDAGHIIFLGIFYTVLAVVAGTIVVAARRGIRDFRGNRAEAMKWHADFDDLPAASRRCRHELNGEVMSRQCPNGFDCRRCEEHARMVPAGTVALEEGSCVAGFDVPGDRLYHRGHTWVRREDDGTLTVGLDDLGTRLMGRPDALRMPGVGSRVVANGKGWEVRRNGVSVRILAPVDGEVVSIGGPGTGWYLRIRPDGEAADLRHLLAPREARLWMLREVERLQLAVAPDAVGAVLADGGMPLDDLSSVIPRDRVDDVFGMMFLNP